MPSDSALNFPNIERTWHDLREGIESSREMVRQSRVLIELSESDPPVLADADDRVAD